MIQLIAFIYSKLPSLYAVSTFLLGVYASLLIILPIYFFFYDNPEGLSVAEYIELIPQSSKDNVLLQPNKSTFIVLEPDAPQTLPHCTCKLCTCPCMCDSSQSFHSKIPSQR